MRDEKLVSVAVKSKQPVESVVWVWGAILESASEVDDAGRFEFDTAEAAYFLRSDEADLVSILNALTDAGRVAEGVVVKWSDRQYQSDKSVARQAAYRERKRGSGSNGHVQKAVSDVTPPSRHRHVTAQDTDTDTEPEKKERKNLTVLSKEKRGTRIPDDFEPDESCHKLAEVLLLSMRESQDALANFIDYWRGVPGAKGLKLDWQATFRNQLRHVAKGKKNGKDSTNTIKGGFDVIDRALLDLRHRQSNPRSGSGEAHPQDLPRLRQIAP